MSRFRTSLAALLAIASFLLPTAQLVADPSDEKNKNPFKVVTLEDVFETVVGGGIVIRIVPGTSPGTLQLISIAIAVNNKYSYELSVARQVCEKIAPAGRLRVTPPHTETFRDTNTRFGFETWSIHKQSNVYCKNPKRYPEWTGVCGKGRHAIELLDASPMLAEWDADSPLAGQTFNMAYETSFRSDDMEMDGANAWINITRTCREAGGLLEGLGATTITVPGGSSNPPGGTLTETILAFNCCVSDIPGEPV